MRLSVLAVLLIPLLANAQTFTDRSDLFSVDRARGFGISVVDVDGDGRVDITDADGFHRQTDVGFEYVAVQQSASPSSSLGMLVADIDRDGIRELIKLTNLVPVPFRYHPSRGQAAYVPETGIDNFVSTALVQGSVLLDDAEDGLVDLFIGDDGPPDVLLQNTGTGFSNVSETLLPRGESGTYGAAAADFDNDGDSDIYIGLCRESNGGIENYLYRRDATGFVEVSESAGVDDPNPSWGVTWFDFDNDGWLDLFVANEAPSDALSGLNTLYRNLGTGSFEEASATAGVAGRTDERSWSAVAADFDNDGWTDLFVANWPQASRLWRNKGDGTFEDITASAGLADTPSFPLSGGDVNDDGWIDLVTEKELFLNEGGSNNWLQIQLRGTDSSPDGIGARIEVEAGGQTQIREITAGDGLMSQSHALEAHVGLGTATSADVTIRWPSSTVTELASVSPNQRITVVEGEGLNTPPARFDLTGPADGSTVSDPIVLTWQTATDTDAVTYTVTLVRPDDSELTYSTTDPSVSIPFSDITVAGEYQWAVVADDGRTPRTSLSRRTFSPGAVATEQEPESLRLTLSVSPNPAFGSATLRIDGTGELPGIIDILDARGRLVSTRQLEAGIPDIELAMDGEPPGLYLVRVLLEDGHSVTTTLLRAR